MVLSYGGSKSLDNNNPHMHNSPNGPFLITRPLGSSLNLLGAWTDNSFGLVPYSSSGLGGRKKNWVHAFFLVSEQEHEPFLFFFCVHEKLLIDMRDDGRNDERTQNHSDSRPIVLYTNHGQGKGRDRKLISMLHTFVQDRV